METIIHTVFTERKNVFISGEAGTGKSYTSVLLSDIAKKIGVNLVLTSTTGITAINIKGTTVHRWSGIKIANENVQTIANRIRIKDKKCMKRWMNTDILLIDEISLLGKKTFILLDTLGRILRRINKPFGGIQLIVTGDFLQLPPVQDDYCFTCPLWDNCDFSYIRLSEPKRYNDINHFYMLQRIRMGKHTNEDISLLKTRVNAYYDFIRNGEKELIKPTIITSLKAEVCSINKTEMDKLKSDAYLYDSKDTILDNNDKVVLEDINPSDFLDTIVDRTVTLKKGAQVMLIFNMDVELGLCNGSRGVVLSCEKDHVVVKFKNIEQEVTITPVSFEIREGDYKFIRQQIPLVIAYAITIHKSQGSTLDCAVVNIGSTVFGDNMSYVALGRVKSIEGLYISRFSPNKITTCKTALEFEEKIIGMNILKSVLEEVKSPSGDCSICLDSLQNDVIKTVCNHHFHKECLERYFHSINEKQCPYCRRDLDKIEKI